MKACHPRTLIVREAQLDVEQQAQGKHEYRHIDQGTNQGIGESALLEVDQIVEEKGGQGFVVLSVLTRLGHDIGSPISPK